MGPQAASLANAPRIGGTMMRRDPVLLTTLLCLDPVGVLVRLKASGSDIARAAAVISGPAEPPSLSVTAVRRWMAAVGDAADDLTAIWHYAPTASSRSGSLSCRDSGTGRAAHPANAGGDRRRSSGCRHPRVRAMGHLLDRLLALVVDDPSRTPAKALLTHARKLA